jgi:hypothetical protein
MSITYIGFIVISISLIIFVVAPRLLVPWAIAVSVLQAASVFNVSGVFPIGVSPYFFVTLLICLRFFPLWLSGQLGFGRDESVCLYVRPLLLMVLWGVLSATVLPVLFSGALVDSPRGGMDALSAIPLQWTWSNVAQAGYLVLNFVFIVYMLWQSADRNQIERCIAAFRWSGAFAAAVGAYQLLAHFTGLPYPASFFNSNLAWAQLTDQSIGGAWRVSATFTEPSAAGSYFAMWTTLLLFSALGGERVTWSDYFLLVSGIVMLALTTSAAGYLVGATVLVLLFGKQMLDLLVRGVIGRRILFILVIVVSALMAGLMLLPNVRHVLHEVIWQKSQSSSGRDREATAFHALYLGFETVGLGVGLGSNRPSGLLFYILSNMGIPGLLLFSYLLHVTRVLTAQAPTRWISERFGSWIRACGWAFAVELLAALIAGAEITAPALWVSWGILLAVCRYVYLTNQQLTADNAVADEPILLERLAFPPIPLLDVVPDAGAHP